MDSYPWKEHDNGEPYIMLRTSDGIFELNRYDTHIFMPNEVAYRGLRHVFHITETNEDTDRYEGLYMWASQFKKVGYDLDVLIQEMQERDFHTEYFDEPHPDDLRAYEKAHGEPFKPKTLEELADEAEPSKLFEKVVQAAMKDFDAKAYYYLSEWADGTE